MQNDFKEKTVIITGGSEGVGAATARIFADAGANLVLAARGKKAAEGYDGFSRILEFFRTRVAPLVERTTSAA